MTKFYTIIPECLNCIDMKTKDEKGKPIIIQVPCTKIKNKSCELYENPAVMWARPGGCIYPKASSSVKNTIEEAGVRKFRRR